MAVTTAERNRRKRERKKREREQRRKQEQSEVESKKKEKNEERDDVEIEYVAEPMAVLQPSSEASASQVAGLPPPEVGPNDMESVLRRFQERAGVATVVTDDEKKTEHSKSAEEESTSDNDDEEEKKPMSKRKLREILRPSVAELKRRVRRPDLVEAHDVTAPDPDFLIFLKGIPGTVPVPRHWGRKRKYLQGKRGFEKPPFKLPDFIVKTGISEIRDTIAQDESSMSAKQKNRARVAPKLGAIDVDYRTLHDAFFKFQTIPPGLTRFGDLYYEGKELETKTDLQPGGPLSQKLRDALGMTTVSSPPPWLINMQRYGPPPSYPGLKIPGLNAPLPNEDCQYGYHPGGWGKPPVDSYGRPLYGGNPLDPPGSQSSKEADAVTDFVTSSGKTLQKASWGSLPHGALDEAEESSAEESSDDEEMEESSDEEAAVVETTKDGIESVLPPPPTTAIPGNLRKTVQAGDETPIATPSKQLYQILETRQAQNESGAVFKSETVYAVPGTAPTAAKVPEGAESVLAKQGEANKGKVNVDAEEEDLGKNFKF